MVASLPAGKRNHPAATFDAAASKHLVAAMRAWVNDRDMPSAELAESRLGVSASHPAVGPFRRAAELVAKAGDPDAMRDASGALAAGMQAVGLDRWRGALRDDAERAQSDLPPLGPGQTYQFRLEPAPAGIQTVAIDFDPRAVPLTPEAETVDKALVLIGRTVIAEVNAELLEQPVQSASNTLHARFAAAVTAIKLPGVRVEQSFNQSGGDANYGELGSVRTDVIFINERTDRVEGIWDWKVGGAKLSLRRAQALSERVSGVAGRADLPPYRIPVRELHINPTIRSVP